MKTLQEKKIEKLEELVVYLKALTISKSPDEDLENELIDTIAAIDKEIEQGEENKKGFDIEGLRKHFQNTPIEILRKEWNKIVEKYPAKVDTDKRKRAEEISYVICRNFVGEWLWNAPKYGDIRSSESFSLDQSRDAASMILRFIKQYASQSGYPEVTDKMIKTEMDNYFNKLQRNPLPDIERFRIEVAFEYAAKWAREQMKNR